MNQEVRKEKKIAAVIPYLAIFLLTFIISLVLVSNPFSEVLAKHDSSMFTYFGYAMDKGKIMYTEIFDHKGPIIFILNYFGILLSTTTFSGIYIIEFISLFLFFVFTYKLSKLWIPDLTAFVPLIIEAIVLIFFLEGGNLTEEYALPFIAYSLYVFSKFYKLDKQIVWYDILLLGVSFSVVFLLRANMISLWLIICLIILIEFIFIKKYKELFKVGALFVLGMLCILIPICLYLYLNDALQAGIFQSLIFNFMYLDSSGEKYESIKTLYTLLSNHYVVALFSIFLLYVVYKWKEYTNNERILSIAALLFTLISFYMSVMSGRDYKHYLMAMVPTMSIPLIFIIKGIRKNVAGVKLFFSFCIVLIILYGNQFNSIYETIYSTNTNIINIDESNGISRKEQVMLFNANKRNEAEAISKIIKENTNENDKIYVHRRAGNLYLLSERLSSIKYFNLPAVDLNENTIIGEDFLKEITNSDTKLIALDSSFYHKDKIDVELSFYEFVVEKYNLINEKNGFYIFLRK